MGFKPAEKGARRLVWMFFDIRGPLGLREYRWAFLAMVLIWIASFIAVFLIVVATPFQEATLAIIIPVAWMILALLIKRMRDTGLPAFGSFLLYVTGLWPFALIAGLFLKSHSLGP